MVNLSPFAAVTNVVMLEGSLDECRYAMTHVSSVGITVLLVPPRAEHPFAVIVTDARHSATLKAAMRMARDSATRRARK